MTELAVPHTEGLPAVTPPVLALDIGGTKLATAVVDAEGGVHGLEVGPTTRGGGPGPVLDDLARQAERSLTRAASSMPYDHLDEAIGAIGITSGGPLDIGTGRVSPTHLPDWHDVPVTDWATARFGRPAVVDNDATAAALAEHRWGAGRGLGSVLYLTLSTGLGGGLVIDGVPFRGATGNGGEPGHLLVVPGGRPCSCGRRGCLEAYCSGTSIAARAAEVSGTRVDAKDLATMARAGDPVAIRIWQETADLLAQGIVDLANVWDPELVVLGGGVSRSADLLLGPIRHAVATQAMTPTRSCRVEATALGESTALLGAGAIGHLMITDDLPTRPTIGRP
ncbi:ROK family protein [Propionibacteriaceae bacterium Y2011]